ncbi:MAG: transglycosylase SLT domain-containing protein [Spirochaetota bacterium]
MEAFVRYRTPYDAPSRKRYLLPVFFVVLLATSGGSHNTPTHDTRQTGYSPTLSESRSSAYWAGTDRYFPNVANYLEKHDPSLELYREPLTREAVIDFFVRIAGSEEVVVPVLENAERYGITPTQAFTIAYIESSYRTDVVNINPDPRSVDRGLFQLNDRSFPQLSDDDFFHPDTNSRYAMRHLRYAMDRAGDDYLTAIAIYNAGERRVLAGNTPASTRSYVARAEEYRQFLVQQFRSYILRHFPPEPTAVVAQ